LRFIILQVCLLIILFISTLLIIFWWKNFSEFLWKCLWKKSENFSENVRTRNFRYVAECFRKFFSIISKTFRVSLILKDLQNLLQYIQYIARNRYCPIGKVKRLCTRGDKFIVKVREESSALGITQEIIRRDLEKTYSKHDAETSGLIIILGLVVKKLIT